MFRDKGPLLPTHGHALLAGANLVQGAPRRAYFTVSSTKSITCLILFPSGRVLISGTSMTGSLSFTNSVSKLVTPFVTSGTVVTP